MDPYPGEKTVDIAVYLGLVPEPPPPLEPADDFVASAPPPPPQIIGGILHTGCKMLLGGTSKSNKSWALLDLATSVAGGVDWWGRPTTQCRVLYTNFELHRWALAQRFEAVVRAKPGLSRVKHNLTFWNWRGRAADISTLRPELERTLDNEDFGLIIVDPVYKVLGDRDENSNGDISALLNEFERLASRTGAAIALAHHFAKGDSTTKNAMDRMSGAGAWARDPDSLLIMTPHEEPGCFTVTTVLRNLPVLPEFVLAWDYPLLRVRSGLDPAALRTPSKKRKVMTDTEFADKLFPGRTALTRARLLEAGEAAGISRTSVDRYLGRLVTTGLLTKGSGLYWRT